MEEGLGEVQREAKSHFPPPDAANQSRPGNQIDPASNESGLDLLEFPSKAQLPPYAQLGYTLLRREWIPAQSLEYTELHHPQLGVRAIILSNQDPYTLFSIAVRTNPADDSGALHALEHLVLQGSKNFPILDPTIKYEQESLGISNAITCGDFTYFFARSPNAQDLRNLTAIVLDAFCHPLLREESLTQDIVRVELDSSGAPRLNGAMLNEISGAGANPEEVATYQAVAELFPGSSFAFDSGGSPQGVMHLTIQQIREHFERYYNPANAVLVFYGAGDHSEALEQATTALQQCGRIGAPAPVLPPQRVTQPKIVIGNYPCDPELANGAEIHSALLWKIGREYSGALSDLVYSAVFDVPNAPLPSRLVANGICTGTENICHDLETPERVFGFKTSLRLKQDLAKLEELTLEELEGLAKKGFPPELTLRLIDALDVSYRQERLEGKRNEHLAEKTIEAVFHGYDPVRELSFDLALAELRTAVLAGQDIIAKFINDALIHNPERVAFGSCPDQALHAAIERESWETAKSRANEAVAPNIEGIGLVWESRKNSLAGTPIVNLDPKDLVNSKPQLWRLQPERKGQLLLYDESTRGLVYMTLAFDVALSPELCPYAEIVGQSMFSQPFWSAYGMYGDVSCGLQYGRSYPEGKAVAKLLVQGCALEDNAPLLLAAIKEQIERVDFFQRQRLYETLCLSKIATKGDLLGDPIEAAILRAESKHSAVKALEENCEGINHYYFLKECLRGFNLGWRDFGERVSAAARSIFRGCQIALAGDGPALRDLEAKAHEASLSFAPQSDDRGQIALTTQVNEALKGSLFSSNISYVAQSFDLEALGYKYSGAMDVVLELIRHAYLWPRLRFGNGVYTPDIKFDKHTGVLTFSSAYDTALEQTVSVWKNTGSWLAEHANKVTQLRRCKLSASGLLFRAIDFEEQWSDHVFDTLCGYPSTSASDRHAQIMACSKDDCSELAQLVSKLKPDSPMVIIGSPPAIKKAQQVLGTSLEIMRI